MCSSRRKLRFRGIIQQLELLLDIAARSLIPESVENVDVESERFLYRARRLRRRERWAIAWWTSRRFCFRAKAIKSMPPLLLRGSPSPPWFTFSYSTESAGRRCSSRLSALLGRRAGFSHRLVVARFSGFLHTDSFTAACSRDRNLRLVSFIGFYRNSGQ